MAQARIALRVDDLYQLYVNGELVGGYGPYYSTPLGGSSTNIGEGAWNGSSDVVAAANATNATLKLGTQIQNDGTSLTKQFTGEMADVRIWNTTRTDAQIADNMNTVIVGDESGEVAEREVGGARCRRGHERWLYRCMAASTPCSRIISTASAASWMATSSNSRSRLPGRRSTWSFPDWVPGGLPTPIRTRRNSSVRS